MKNFKVILPLMASCLLFSFSFDSMAAGGVYNNDFYYYLGGGVGYSRLNGEDFTGTNGDLKKSHLFGKGLVGVRINQRWALEGQYVDFGTVHRDSDSVQAKGWTAGVVVNFLKEGTIIPYGKAGAVFWNTDNQFNSVRREDDGTDVTLGAGFHFGLSNNFSLRAEYERYMMGHTDVDSLSLIAQYNFAGM